MIRLAKGQNKNKCGKTFDDFLKMYSVNNISNYIGEKGRKHTNWLRKLVLYTFIKITPYAFYRAI